MFGVNGNFGAMKDFVDALEAAGVPSSAYVTMDSMFNGSIPVRITGQEFGYYNPTTKTITLLNNGSGSNAT